MKTVINTVVVGALLIIAAIIFVVFSGVFNVSALWDDPLLLRVLLVETREASVKKHAQEITAPKLNASGRIENGFRSYREMCVVCHTPPGGSDSPLTQGLNPPPPDLAKLEDHVMSSAEIFWVIKNGIRMTGMPAWGPSHDDAEIWDIVAFIRTLPTLDAEAYRRLEQQTPAGHGHAGGTSGHMKKQTPSPVESGAVNGHSSSHSVVAPSTNQTHGETARPNEHESNGAHAH